MKLQFFFALVLECPCVNLEQQLYIDFLEWNKTEEQRELIIPKEIDSGSNPTLYCNSIGFSSHGHDYIYSTFTYNYKNDRQESKSERKR